MNNMKLGKKGAVPSVVGDYIGYAVFAVLILVFFALFKLSIEAKVNEAKATDFPELETEQILLNYLRTPVELDSQKITAADYIALLYERKDAAMTDKIKNDFTSLADKLDVLFCFVVISDSPGLSLSYANIFKSSKIVVLQNPCVPTSKNQKFGAAEVPIVLKDGRNIYLKSQIGYGER